MLTCGLREAADARVDAETQIQLPASAFASAADDAKKWREAEKSRREQEAQSSRG
jgi:hypothetical protein